VGGFRKGGRVNSADRAEHIDAADAKRVVVMGFDGSDFNIVNVNSSGQLSTTGGGGGGGNAEYAEDTAHTTGDTGVFVMGVQRDAAAATFGQDGDYVPFQMDLKGRLQVMTPTAVSWDGAGSTTATAGTVAGLRRDADTSPVDTDGDFHPFIFDDAGRLKVDVDFPATQPVSIAAAVAVTDNGGSLTVDDGGTTLSIDDGGGAITVDGTVSVSGNVGSAAEHAEDSGHSSGDTGVHMLGVVNASDSSLVDADLDYASIQLDVQGRLRTDAAGSIYPEDSAHASGNSGTFVLAVRSGSTGALAGDGDYHPFVIDNSGHLKVTNLGRVFLIAAGLTEDAHDLNAAAYNQTTAEAVDFILDSIELNFTTTEQRTITLSTSAGTTFYTRAADNSQHFVISKINKAFINGDQLTLNISQTAGACSVDVRLILRRAE